MEDILGLLVGICQFIVLVFIHAIVCFHSDIYKALRTTKSGRIISFMGLGMFLIFVVAAVLHYTGLYTGSTALVSMFVNKV